MKTFKNFLCLIMMLMSSVFMLACNDSPNDVKVTFGTLKTITEKEDDINNWQGLSITTISSNRGNSTFKSNKNKDENNNVNLDFIYENGNDKIYCDDNIRYYIENNRKYIDETYFDYNDFIEVFLDDCLDEIDNFFNNEQNSNNILKSNKTEDNDYITYTFEISLDKSSKKVLVASYIFTKQNNLVEIDVSILINSEKEYESEISENDEIIVTPEWFDSNEYKTDLTYDDVKSVVLDENLFNNWTNVEVKDEIFHQMGWQGANYTEYYFSKIGENNVNLIQTNETDKSYYVNGVEYLYQNNEAYSKEVTDNYTFDSVLDALFSYFAQIFIVEDENKQYYTNSKKYEKDRTIISFRLFDDADQNPNITEDEISFGSLYFDLEGNLYYIDLMLDGAVTNYEEKHLTYKKLSDDLTAPTWFDKNDFANL